MDYELLGIGLPISDVCYLICMMKVNDTTIDEEAILKHYYETLTSFGDKVTTENYTFE